MKNSLSIDWESLFLRGLCFVYFVAFSSFYVQFPGLVGSNGLMPGDAFLNSLLKYQGEDVVYKLPCIWWLARYIDLPFDVLVELVLVAAIIVSAIGGIFEPSVVSLSFLWFTYLSVCKIGQLFLSFQWDILLLESGFLSILFLLAPHRKSIRCSPVGWLYRWLLFRILFMSTFPLGSEQNLVLFRWRFEISIWM